MNDHHVDPRDVAAATAAYLADAVARLLREDLNLTTVDVLAVMQRISRRWPRGRSVNAGTANAQWVSEPTGR